MKIMNVFLALVFSCAGMLSVAQPSLFSYEKFISKEKDTLLYRQLWPDYNTTRKYPLVIFLHGSGERGHDNEAQLKWGAQQFAKEQTMLAYPCIVIAPQCPGGMQWANVSNTHSGGMLLESKPARPMELLMELLQQVKKTLPVDTDRIYITGLSMGGYGAFDALMRYPREFAAAVPVCGGGDISKAASIASIPIWVFSGAEDPAVDPQLSLDMVNALMRAGGHPGYTQYPEVGHFSWLGTYSDPQLFSWLFRQHRRH